MACCFARQLAAPMRTDLAKRGRLVQAADVGLQH
jgi:hypothetical protein